MLTIKGWITEEAQKVELLAGRPAHRDREFTTDDVSVIARALALGAQVNTAGDVLFRMSRSGYTTVFEEWTRVPTDAADAISLWEEIRATEASKKAAEAAERAATAVAAEAAVRAAFARDGDIALVRSTDGGRDGHFQCSVPECRTETSYWNFVVCAEVPPDLLEVARTAAKRFSAETRATAEAKAKAHEVEHRERLERETRRAYARLELLAQLCRDWGDESARERLAQRLLPDGNPLGLLPEAEAVDFVTDHLLPLDPGAGLAPYVKITTKEVGKFCVVDYDYGEPHTDFVFLAKAADDPDVGGLSSEEWATVKRVSGAIDQWRVERPFPGVVWVVEPRVHRGQCRERECPTWPVRRVGVKVTVTLDDVLAVSREYGAPE